MDTSIAVHEEYAREPSPELRDELIDKHLGLVHHVARQLSNRLSADVDFDELVSSGAMGLMKALDSFDPSRGLAFSTFAAPRVRGAILDELRRQDHVPRSLRRKSRDINTAREAYTQEYGYAPDDRELAESMDVELETLWRWQSEIEGVFHIPLDRPAGDDESMPKPKDSLAGETGEQIEDEINLQQEIHVLRDAILGLKEQERVVLSLYYFEELKLHEIATILELTESRVSQIRSKAVSRLRAEMAPLRERVA